MRRFAKQFILAFCLVILTASLSLAGELTLAAAASLREAVNELSDAFIRKHPDVKIIKNYGASGTLARQIEGGAPADIVISANLEWVNYLKEKKLVEPSTIDTFAFNSLVFVGTASRKLTGMKDLPKLGKIAIGSPKSVPAGEYAVKAIKKLGLEKELAAKLVIAKDVREAMKYAELGEVDGAFVYRTDALLLGKRTKILFNVPEGLHDRIIYPMVLTSAGTRKKDAREFLEFLRSAGAKNVLARYGFLTR
ncbi:MAG: molybdate ABC transporter substrate-binding protein [Geobacter sp.]|nr:molybdate ABC transporter substrate-binding protein [Geobacter sp.]